MSRNDIVGIMHDKADEIKNFGVKKIGIFGSFVKSAQNRGSDIDILVEFYPEQKIFDNYMELKFYLEKLFKRKVDLVIKGTLKPAIKQSILREVIYA